MYDLFLDARAREDLDALQGSLWQRVREALLSLRANPRPPGCVKLRGVGGAYRLWVGDYRVIYEVDDAASTVTVGRVRHRREVYRNL